MASKLRHVNLPIPFRGMNTDTSPSQIGPEYAPYARNVVLNEQGQVRARRGWLRRANWSANSSSDPTDMYMMNATTHQLENGDSSAIVSCWEDAVANVLGWVNGYPTGPEPSGFTAFYPTAIIDRFLSRNGTTGAVSNAAVATALSGLNITGRTVAYNGITYGVSFASGDVEGYSTLVLWAGGNVVAHSTGGVTLSNGASTGTFSSAPATSMANGLLFVSAGATGPVAPYRYVYRIRTHTAAATSFTIAEDYGLDETTTNVPNAVGATTTIAVRAAHIADNAPTRIGCVGLFRERLFVGRGSPVTPGVGSSANKYLPNALYWSSEGQPQKWPAQNFLLVGESDEPIMALAELNDVLYVFQRTRTWALTGYDEDSFALQLVSNSVGCVHSSSICYHEGSVFWAAEDGLYTASGGAPTPVTHPSPGTGIQKDYLELMASVDGTRSQQRNRVVSCAVYDSKLFMSINLPFNPAGYETQPDAFVLDLRTGAWTRWGNSIQSGGDHQPQFYARMGPQMWAFSAWQAVDISGCYGPESVGTAASLLTDENYAANGSTTTSEIQAELRFADLRLSAADTIRVRGVQVEHACQYFAASSSPRVAWAVTLDYDPDIDSSALVVGDVSARYVGNISTPLYDKYFTDRFTNSTFPTEGATFRVRMVKSASAHVSKVFRVNLLTDGQATKLGRVDNATT